MKKNAITLFLFTLFLLTGCQKDDISNPKTITLPANNFTITLNEVRDQKEITWTVENDNAGYCTLQNDLNESIRIPVVTKVKGNTFTLRTSQPVNAECSDPSVVKVTKTDTEGKVYSLTYKGEGNATIKLWNGDESGRITKTFAVNAQPEVAVEGLWFRFGWNHLDWESEWMDEEQRKAFFTEPYDLVITDYLTSRPDWIVTREGENYEGRYKASWPIKTSFDTQDYPPMLTYKEIVDKGLVYEGLSEHQKGIVNGNYTYNPNNYANYGYWYRKPEEGSLYFRYRNDSGWDKSSGAMVEFVGLWPENCSRRRIKSFESNLGYTYPFSNNISNAQFLFDRGICEEGDPDAYWPNDYNIDKDAWDYSGKKIWVDVYNDGMSHQLYAYVEVEENGKTKYYYAVNNTYNYR